MLNIYDCVSLNFMEDNMLSGKKILLGVTGGIAAYKAVDLASKLVKQGAFVKTIMTDSATKLVSPLTFRSITKESVSTELFNDNAPIEHISLADWCDIAVIAPATANIIGKIAGGIADDLLTTSIMATRAPKLIVPAMNVNMWNNVIFLDNLRKLKSIGYSIVPPESGMLACGYEGKGRFPDPSEIMYFIRTYLLYKRDLESKNIMITAGACREYIDPVRYLSNVSSGKMGLALARAASIRGAHVNFFYSAIQDKAPYYLFDSFQCSNSDSMHKIVKGLLADNDIVIMTAAVTDYRPKISSISKIKKSTEALSLEIEPTTDILADIYSNKSKNQTIVGFAAETDNLKENAHMKLKKCDIIIANDVAVAGKDETKVRVILSTGKEIPLQGDKFDVAQKIIDLVKQYHIKR